MAARRFPAGQTPVRRRLPSGCYASGYLLPTKNQFVEYVSHASEKWSGNRMIVSAHTTRMTSDLTDQDRDQLRELLFPLPVRDLMAQTSEEQLVSGKPKSPSSTRQLDIRQTAIWQEL